MERDRGFCQQNICYNHVVASVIIPAFYFRQKGYINFVSKSVHRLSVTFLENVSPPKRLDVATSDFVGE